MSGCGPESAGARSTKSTKPTRPLPKPENIGRQCCAATQGETRARQRTGRLGEKTSGIITRTEFILRGSTRRCGQWRTIAYVPSRFRSSSFGSRPGPEPETRGFDRKLSPPPTHLIFALCCPSLWLIGKRCAGPGPFIHATWFATLNGPSPILDNIGAGGVVYLLQSPSFLIFSARSLSRRSQARMSPHRFRPCRVTARQPTDFRPRVYR